MFTDVLFGLPVRKPWLTLFIVALFAGLFSFGAQNLYFRGDYKVFFHDDSPELIKFTEQQDRFKAAQGIAIIIEDPSGNVFNETTLNIVRELTELGWEFPYAIRSSSLANFQYTTADGDDMVVEPLIGDDNSLTPKNIEYIKNIALTDANTAGVLVSRSGQLALVSVTVQLPEDGGLTEQVIEIVRHTNKIIADAKEKAPELIFRKSGSIALNDAFGVAAAQDVRTLIPMMFAAVMVFLGLLLRSWRFVFATMLVLGTAVSMTMGLLGWTGHYLTNITIGVPMLLLTLAVADCVHIITGYIHGLNKGKGQTEAIKYSLELNFIALLVTSVTTSFGFLMMNASVSPALIDFGNLAAVGVMIAFILSVTLLPAILALMPIKTSTSRVDEQDESMLKIAEWVISHHRKVLPIAAIVVIASGFLMSQNELNDELVKYFKTGSDYREQASFLDDKVGNTTLTITLDTGEAQGITKVEFLKTLDAFTNWLYEQPEVNHVSSLVDVMRRLNKNLNGDDPNYYKIPSTDEMGAQYLLMYELSLPYGQDLNSHVDFNKSAVRVTAIMRSLGSKGMIELESKVEDWLDKNASGYGYEITDLSVMFAHIGASNLKSMIVTLPLALGVISALLILALRSWRLGILSLIPNCAPIIVGFGAWYLVSGEINIAVSVVVSMTLGIVVDDTVHFLTKYRKAREEGKSVEDGVRYAFVTVGRALWVTTVVLCTGFALLATSDFVPNASMGFLSAVVVMFALLGDFFMLPAILLLIDRKAYLNKKASLVESSCR
ncbi:RND transporter [Veronia nyctiphanis]|uniref:RND transporter n=1 Tax=Veronia nyctiphanis TaxID=1278244 RepID=A0A4Q0Z0B0_9GAMM|nr:MMPL family transporter [Veronia nyctiphanis]RXJ74841.1 RND transporter [Veronia nyctiphanis]